MSRHRSGPTSPTTITTTTARPLRVFASGTLFLTHTLSLPTHPSPSSSTRAQSYVRTRGGSAASILSVLAQFGQTSCHLIAPLGANADARALTAELERDGVSTRFCRSTPGAGVPAAWVLHAADAQTQTVINHNPLPDITHDEFVAHLGPLLAPENYPDYSPASTPSPSPSSTGWPTSSPAPFDWLHFEGRSVKTTLSNLAGVDGLARERRWRAHCVFSVDVGRRARQGVEALIPHADVLFLNRHYAQTHSPAHARSPRAFLLSLAPLAPPHALLVAYWGADGAAVLSVPTREYFQSSGWAQPSPSPGPGRGVVGDVSMDVGDGMGEVESVRSGSEFWAGRRASASESSAFFSAAALSSIASPPPPPRRNKGKGRARGYGDDSDDGADSDGTEVAGPASGGGGGGGSGAGVGAGGAPLDDAGAQDAFVAGMIYALSRRLLPGAPYAPGLAGTTTAHHPGAGAYDGGGRWRLDECLRFATELAGRKGRNGGWEGLGDEMGRAGWFDG